MNNGVSSSHLVLPHKYAMGEPHSYMVTEVLTEVDAMPDNGGMSQNGHLKWKINEPKEVLNENGKRIYLKLFGKLVISLVCGIVFGFAMEKGRVFDPRVIRGQFIFTKFVMLKMFLAAGVMSLFLMGILSVIPQTKTLLQVTRISLVSTYSTKGLLTTTAGGFILGVGMQLSGSCPAMVLVQVGTAVGNGSACVTLVAGLLGAFVYGLVEPYLTKLLSPKKPLNRLLLDDYLPIPFFVLTSAVGFLMVAAVVGLEFAYPWKEEVQIGNETVGCLFSEFAWPPYVSGVIIGCLQVPLILFIGNTIGGSQSYCTIVSQLLFTERLRAISPYLSPYARGIGNWWQVFYVIGAILGGLFSALASDSIASVPGVGYAFSFVGGFCCIFGARLAAGCTSGHGLSGIGSLSLLSFAAVPSMFAGGISAGFIMKFSVGNIDDYYSI
ncbi:thiosulfate transporter TsuA-like [Antedon mediterranea]|uniref:thiosulfate transporter TsuA-like n=1 Tax=Antedon mediterranea TaxID=105859 RepID=UPI003AF8BC17